jgi:putative solute:sodium symporter small subunit
LKAVSPRNAPSGAARRRANEGTPMDDRTEVYWDRTKRLMWIMMAIWVVFGYVIHFFVAPLNAIKIAGFPLGFYMASQGSLIVFVVMLFWFARKQDQIDRESGVAEEE